MTELRGVSQPPAGLPSASGRWRILPETPCPDPPARIQHRNLIDEHAAHPQSHAEKCRRRLDGRPRRVIPTARICLRTDPGQVPRSTAQAGPDRPACDLPQLTAGEHEAERDGELRAAVSLALPLVEVPKAAASRQSGRISLSELGSQPDQAFPDSWRLTLKMPAYERTATYTSPYPSLPKSSTRPISAPLGTPHRSGLLKRLS